jgi:hypothetical protein
MNCYVIHRGRWKRGNRSKRQLYFGILLSVSRSKYKLVMVLNAVTYLGDH